MQDEMLSLGNNDEEKPVLEDNDKEGYQEGQLPEITIVRGKQQYKLRCEAGESILQVMLRNSIYLSAYCGGRGVCGKCKIRLLEGHLDITEPDRKFFTEEELKEGYRLSCFAYPGHICKVQLMEGDEGNFRIVTEGLAASNGGTAVDDSYGIAIDIGTTTIAISLVGLLSKKVLHTHTMVNKQRAYGADVLSRIKYVNEGNLALLQGIIREELQKGIEELVKDTKIDKNKIQSVAIAGNTTMGHILMGYPCVSLGVYPFNPYDIKTTTKKYQEIFQSDYLTAKVTLLPGISAFVGADIVAGLTVCNFDREEVSLLVDLGTNGEMAIGNQDKILVTSTAAGPAFEGGNIRCGCASVAGAICKVRFDDKKVQYSTIQDKPPIGICGTGVVEILSELLRAEYMDETGLLIDEYFEEGFVLTEGAKGQEAEQTRLVFTQKDIREVQMAKAAVRAGIEVLMESYGVNCEQIDAVYLAGGFGYHMDIKKAVHIGLLPNALEGKIKAVGNSSLAGAISYLLESNTRERMERIVSVTKEIHLANEVSFQDYYMDYMYF